MKKQIQELIKESIQTKETLLKDKNTLLGIEKAINLIVATIKNHKKIVIFGNGGSAADAQHFACELVNKFKMERSPLPAISLVTDTSILSSISNDVGYDYVFSKQIEALGEKGDIAIAITTSDVERKKGGHSANIANGLIVARKKGLIAIGLLSDKSKKVLEIVDLPIKVPSKNTPRIQEVHITIIHIICEMVEKLLFKDRDERKIN
ncbi:MAG: SIS domain-containing protein [Candidatus Atribacteria bacterium]